MTTDVLDDVLAIVINLFWDVACRGLQAEVRVSLVARARAKSGRDSVVVSFDAPLAIPKPIGLF